MGSAGFNREKNSQFNWLIKVFIVTFAARSMYTLIHVAVKEAHQLLINPFRRTRRSPPPTNAQRDFDSCV
jgi:hypothetical protein